MKVWVICTMLFGYPMPLPDGPEFTNESACIAAIGSMRLATVRESFKLVCVQKDEA